jgi:MoxR-like ATPase
MSDFYFDPKPPRDATEASPGWSPDNEETYVYDEERRFLVNMALATGRPILLLGPTGSGKSSLARWAARELGWTYLRYDVTAATQARDLCWRFDALARLADAQAGNRAKAQDAWRYVFPGVLWEAFDPAGARSQVLRAKGAATASERTKHRGTVVLIDEIDKAEPNVPNDLLIPIGSRRFTVEETGASIEMTPESFEPPDPRVHSPLLIVITSNEERIMPDAFMRRCLPHRLDHPDEAQLLRIARAHLAWRLEKGPNGLAQELATLLVRSREEARTGRKDAPRREPSTAEYLDALKAALAMPADAELVRRLARAIFKKVTEHQTGG